MMLAISFHFITGKYHATVWGNHVNEATPEWPPSPWRILRAIVSTWMRTMDGKDEDLIISILEKMKYPPFFLLPPASLGHTRHYMPWDKLWKKKKEMAKTLVFDSFVVLPKESPVLCIWKDIELSENQKSFLDSILEKIPYLGRAESWCTCNIIEKLEVDKYKKSHILVERLNDKNIDYDIDSLERVLAPNPDVSYKQSLDYNHPLLERTDTLRSKKKNITPTNSIWLYYHRPKECFIESDKKEKNRIENKKILVRYKLDSPVLPLVTEAYKFSRQMRSAAMSIYGGNDKKKSCLLSGKDEIGIPLKGHAHAHYIASDEDNDGRLDHISIYCSSGFDKEHQIALNNVKFIKRYGKDQAINLLLLGITNNVEDSNSPLFMTSRKWKSITPFSLERHPKVNRSGIWKTENISDDIEIIIPDTFYPYPSIPHMLFEYGISPNCEKIQKDGPLYQLLLSFKRRGYPDISKIGPIPAYETKNVKRRWIEFERISPKKTFGRIGSAYGFIVEFSEDVRGPVLAGYGSHHGLGVFKAI